MAAMKFVVCLTTRDNDYQQEQAKDAERTAERLGCFVTVIDAQNDAIEQSQLLLEIIQSKDSRPDAIIFEPVSGTGLPHVARAAASAGIGWVVLNREVDYLSELRLAQKTKIFGVGSDHKEIGRIQGRQVAKLSPGGGEALLITGPTDSGAARLRTEGLLETLPSNVRYKELKGKWTEQSGHHAVSSYLRLSTSHAGHIAIVISQNDAMAAGARRAIQELSGVAERDQWSRTPFIGVDGLPQTGQAWVQRGVLASTVIVPANTGRAMEAYMDSVTSGKLPPEYVLTTPKAFPDLTALRPAFMHSSSGA